MWGYPTKGRGRNIEIMLENENLKRLVKILENYKDKEIPSNEFKYYFEGHEKTNKPDFIALLDLKKAEPIIFQKNYNLKFDSNAKETLHNILNAIDSNQISEIFQVDKRCLEFGEKNIFTAEQGLFQLRFTASLIKGHPRTYLRNILFVNIEHSDSFQPFLFVNITDMTDFTGLKNKAKFNVKFTNDDYMLYQKLYELKKELNNVLNPKVKITYRERQIFQLISIGKTSQEISKDLQISPATVNTHRQNLIKKFSVKNTVSLINILSD